MVAAGNPVSGPDLRLLRIVRGIRLTEVARSYGASRQRLTRIEGTPFVTTATAIRYLAALREVTSEMRP